jgi:hypothetical protein
MHLGQQTGKGGEREGIGLYTYEQAKNTTPFQYFAQIVVGTIIAVLGGLLVYQEISVRGQEIRKYGFAETHIWGWVGSLAVVLIGMFMAHAGVIFYARRLTRKIFGSAQKSHTPLRTHPGRRG